MKTDHPGGGLDAVLRIGGTQILDFVRAHDPRAGHSAQGGGASHSI